MIDFLSSWAEEIIVCIVIIIIFEMLLQNSSNKKYLKIVFGFFIIYVIISPIFSNSLTNAMSDFFKDLVEQSNSSIDDNISGNGNLYYENIDLVNGQVEELYETNLISSIEEDLKLKGYNAKVTNITIDGELIKNISIDIYSSKSEYTNNSNLDFASSNEYSSVNSVNSISVNDISVNINSSNGDTDTSSISKDSSINNNSGSNSENTVDDEYEVLKEYIYNTYNIPIQNIKIEATK